MVHMQFNRQDTAASNCVVSCRLIRAPWATTCGVGGPGNSVATLVGCAEPWVPMKNIRNPFRAVRVPTTSVHTKLYQTWFLWAIVSFDLIVINQILRTAFATCRWQWTYLQAGPLTTYWVCACIQCQDAVSTHIYIYIYIEVSFPWMPRVSILRGITNPRPT